MEKIRLQLLPQASAVAHAVNENYEAANVPVISHAMLQLETATMAWFGRKLTTASPEAQLTFEEWYLVGALFWNKKFQIVL